MNQRKIAALCSIVLGFCSGSTILNHYCTGGYKIVVEGKTIGYVESNSEYESALAEVNSTLSSDFGESYTLNPDAEITGIIVSKSLISSSSELRDNIAELSEYMTDGYVLVVKGEDVCSFKTKAEAEETLSLIIDRFKIDGSTTVIREETDICEKQVSIASITDSASAADWLVSEGILNVKSTINTTYVLTADFETIEEDDETLIKGNRKIVSDGEVGEYSVDAIIEYNNGVQVGKSILSETLLKEAVNEIVKVGTKEIPNMGTGSYIMPTNGRISSNFGSRWGRMHNGIDIATSIGTPIKASDTGIVIFSGYKDSYGNLVKIDHKNGYVTYYAHCSELLVSEGEAVTQGQIIAKVGNTGNSTGPHCHFEIQKDGVPLNPMSFLN